MEKNNKKVIIVLHEIYGINNFIKNICQRFNGIGYDTICPNMLNREAFAYMESQMAYEYFMTQVGFQVCKQIRESIKSLKERYEKVFIVGFSVGATIAWKCCENTLCDGIVACYGSRIRDYVNLNPVCPTYLLFASEDSFDVEYLINQLKEKPNLITKKFNAHHGFMDPFSEYYDEEAACCANNIIYNFLSKCEGH